MYCPWDFVGMKLIESCSNFHLSLLKRSELKFVLNEDKAVQGGHKLDKVRDLKNCENLTENSRKFEFLEKMKMHSSEFFSLKLLRENLKMPWKSLGKLRKISLSEVWPPCFIFPVTVQVKTIQCALQIYSQYNSRASLLATGLQHSIHCSIVV